MRMVEKPEGYDLRDKRAEKSGQGVDWNPQDALYDASQRIQKMDVEALIVVWRERLPNGETGTRFDFSGNRDAAATLLLRALGYHLGWNG